MNAALKPVEALLCGEGCHGGNPQSLIACVEYARPLIFGTTDDPNFQLGPLHAVDWGKPVNFLQELLKPVCRISGHGESAFNVTPLLHYEDGRRIAKAGAGIFLASGIVLADEVKRQIDHKLASFCHAVLARDEPDMQGDFFPVETPEDDSDIAELVEDFLGRHGGKSVGEARFLKTQNRQLLIAGKYRARPDQPLQNLDPWTITGEIDGLRGKSRLLYINVTERKTIEVVFDVQCFKDQLLSRVLDGKCYQFTIKTEVAAQDRAPYDTLVSFSSCETDEASMF